MQIRNNNFMIKLLISSRWRFFRHLLLCILSISIAAGLIWHMLEERQEVNLIEKYGGLFLFTSFFLGGSYLNIYVLTPKLLLKNKWGKYFSTLLSIVLAIMGSIILIQLIYPSDDSTSHDEINFFTIMINFLSSTLSIFLLFIGTTTLVIFKKWILDVQQAEELESSTLQLELKLLENQINPHFLFNMLNNANIMIKKDPYIASLILEKLEEMLRYQMNDNIDEKVRLKKEILFLNDFLELEKTRRDYFTYRISENGNIDNIQIVPLLFISFVENAVKHSQDSQTASYVHVSFNIMDDNLIFICENSLPSKITNKQVGGIGLTNIKRRLDLLFQHNYSLDHTKTETKYTVKLELKL